MAESTFDPILATLSHEVMEWLRSFRYEQSFKEVAARFGRDERTISQQLLRLDQAFWDTQQVHILERELGRKTYRLTKAGEAFAERLGEVLAATRVAIEAATAATRRIPILCSSNCLIRLRELSDALHTASFDIVPENRRTAEIDVGFAQAGPDGDIKICLASALMSSRQNPIVGSITQWTDRVEVLPLRIDPFRLLSVDDLGLSGPPTVRTLVERGVTLLTPRGGVVWEFLNRELPGWWKLRPFQHVPVVDLDGGLKCLASGLVHRSAMVVHGLSQPELEPYGLGHALLRDFSEADEHHLAVVGVFHVRQHEPDGDDDPYDLIWETAQSLWLKEGA
jgi:hypothetical protein